MLGKVGGGGNWERLARHLDYTAKLLSWTERDKRDEKWGVGFNGLVVIEGDQLDSISRVENFE